jgi:WhiB family redox-sensing transcriptional regulator
MTAADPAVTLLRVLLTARSARARWTDLAACAEVDPELWFPEKGASSESAKRICRACPVRAQCLEDALSRSEMHGIWGATSRHERAGMRRSQDRGAA